VTVAQARCLNHATREAVARCPECGRFFCRECVSEYEDRLVCALCLGRLTTRKLPGRRRRLFFRSLLVLVGFIILWLSFYLMGKGLLLVPSSFQPRGFHSWTPRAISVMGTSPYPVPS
jgi:hypothetical protein